MEKKEKGEEITDEDREERGYFESWEKLEGKGIKRGKVRLAIYWMTFKCDDDIPNNAHAKLNKLISDFQFPGNRFGLGIIGNDF